MVLYACMETIGRIASIWRYPVKSLAAQPLDETRVDAGGLPGDREGALYVTSEHARTGKPLRGKENDRFHLTNDVARAARYAAESGVRVEYRCEPGGHVFDDSPVSLIFDRWIDEVSAHVGRALDPRRWRPNFYARAANGFALREPDLVGSTLALGDVLLHVRSTIGRCVTTTYDIDTGEHLDEVLGYVARERGNMMGVYCDVELAGTVRVGDDLRLRAR
ncbi:MAG: MOSC domain-containing protein [Vulcanimicrobiaceae bacterium]